MKCLLEAWQGKRILVVGDVCVDKFFQVTTPGDEKTIPWSYELGEFVGPGKLPISMRDLKNNLVPGRRISKYFERSGMGAFVRDAVKALGGESTLLSISCGYSIKHRAYYEETLLGRYDVEDVKPLSEDAYNIFKEHFERELRDNFWDGIIVADYAKGAINERVMKTIRREAHDLGIFVLVDPSKSTETLDLYKGVDYIKPNQFEWDRFPKEEWLSVSRKIFRTESEKGITLITDEQEKHFDPLIDRLLVDDCGCGDVAAAALALALTVTSPECACPLVNLIAGKAATKLYTTPVSYTEAWSDLKLASVLSNMGVSK